MRVINLLYFILLFILSACQSTPNKPDNFTACPENRPQVCPMIYAPVCAQEKGVQSTSYSSNCTACSHNDVIGFQPGVCPTERKGP